jgi:2-polyprenyl-3-methyl-5-hydroxy-6-metoxy-1,4-benzoquinol methylase
MIHKLILYLTRKLYLVDLIADKETRIKNAAKNNPVTKAFGKIIRPASSLISKKTAADALAEVGRNPLPAFTYFKRPVRSTPDLDSLEELWWNKAGGLVEDIWGMPADVCEAYRNEYAQKAKKFFKQGKDQVRVLDLGCGTGWFGRLIAGDGLFYEGIDFSDTQIAIAKEKSKDFIHKDHLNFEKTTDFTKIKDIREFDGIIINAFLHHLYEDELNGLFSAIKNTFRPGTRIFIMEPVYPTNKPVLSSKAMADDIKCQTISSTINSIKKTAIVAGKYDFMKESAVAALIAESNRNGFFFSPKETAFHFEEFNDFISQYCSVKDYYYVGCQDLAFMQMTALVTDKEMRGSMIREVYPIIKQIDIELINNGYFFNEDKNYIFTCFECSLK